MGKFNFQNYQKELSEKELKFGRFEAIKPAGFGGARRDERPLVNITSRNITLNSAGTEVLTKHGRFVEFMLHQNFLVFRVLQKKSTSSYSLNISKSSGSATTSAGAVLKHIQEETDLMNLNVYKYKFKLQNDEENIYFIDLSDPVIKTKAK